MELKFRGNIFSQIENPVQRETFTVAFISVVVVLLMSVFVIRPAVSSAIKQISNNKLKTELIKKQEAKLKSIEYLTDRISKYDFELSILDKSLATEYDTEFFVVNINDYFKFVSGIQIDSLEFRQSLFSDDGIAVESVPGYQAVDITIKFESDYNGLSEILDFVENFPRVINTRVVTLDPVNGDFPIQGKIDASYYLKESSDI